ncbi:ATP-binding protein [Streptomyces sp. TRM66268-LWL]|uniref:ATP-binding protein n=1 Tax=Streptomyces polyasparticus TaxID=2767826 RepID=A0ABR7SXF8_9ACTN|nr:ATP-binding protein [Streptomyces polyasparticus]MBC9718943.1 ATP-binding protein [Streptomyces polyasparticus]
MHRRFQRGSGSSDTNGPPATPAEARARVRRLLSPRFGSDSREIARDPRVADILLVTSELCSNALTHGGGIAAFGISVEEDEVTLDVADHSFHLPAERADATDLGTPGGYGWKVVERLSSEVSVTLCSDGKVVSARVPLPPRHEPTLAATA